MKERTVPFIRRALCGSVFWLAITGWLVQADAFAMDKLDMAIGMKTLPLLNNKISGNIKIAILYDPDKAGSKKEAESIKAIIDGGLNLPGDLSADGTLVPTSHMEKLAGSKIIIVTSDLEAYYNEINKYAGQYNILTMSTDLNCVYKNKCILGIVSKPRVEIYYSKPAADNAKISFGEAFSALIKTVPY